MRATEPCVICKREGTPYDAVPGKVEIKRFQCARCGVYDACDQDREVWPIRDAERHLVSGFVRDHFRRTGKPYRWEDREESRFPSGLSEPTVSDKIEHALLAIAARSEAFGADVKIMLEDDCALVSARNPVEFGSILGHLTEKGMLRNRSAPGHVKGTPFVYQVSGDGWREVERIRPVRSGGRQAFVAMWFDESMDEAYNKGIHPALSVIGYRPWRADREHFDQKICDRILMEIRRSSLLVVDMTGSRPSVYFEAGFARGLGIPVIWTCREEDAKGLAFDTRQYPHILWREPEQLRVRVEEAVRARYPLPVA